LPDSGDAEAIERFRYQDRTLDAGRRKLEMASFEARATAGWAAAQL